MSETTTTRTRRRDQRTPAEQAAHEICTSMAVQFGGDEVCRVCGEWTTICQQPVECDCEVAA